MIIGANVTVMVSDLEAAIHFYTEVLGLKLDYRADGHWAQVTGPGITIGLHPGRQTRPLAAPHEQMSIGLEVADLASAVKRLQLQGVQFITGIVEGKAVDIAEFADPDGTPLYLHSAYQHDVP